MENKVDILQRENLELKAQNNELGNKIIELTESQKAVQLALILEIKRIESIPKALRWWQYGKLLFSLMDAVRLAVIQSEAK